MKVTAKKKATYAIDINGKPLGEFTVESEWEGLAKMCNPQGCMIISFEKIEFNGFFEGLFSNPTLMDSGKLTIHSIVSASPNLQDMIALLCKGAPDEG